MKKVGFAITTAAMMVIITACGSGHQAKDDSAVAKAALYEQSDRQQYLEKCASEEGGPLLYYTGQNEDLWEPLTAAFMNKYPSIKVETVRRNSFETAAAISEEARAGGRVDVQTLSSVVQPSLTEFYQNFASPELAAYPKDAMTKDGNAVVTSRLPYGLMYNTDLVAESDVPQSPEDILDERFDGRLALSSSTQGTNWFGIMIHLLGEDVMPKIGALHPRVQDLNSGALASMVAAGEAELAPASPIVRSIDMAAKGAPVAWSPVTAYWVDDVIGLSSTAPHPCSAMLFIDFSLSKEGQSVSAAYDSSRTDMPANTYLNLEQYGDRFQPLTLEEVVGDGDYSQDVQHWTEMIESEVVG